jgi:hypothetical protein
MTDASAVLEVPRYAGIDSGTVKPFCISNAHGVSRNKFFCTNLAYIDSDMIVDLVSRHDTKVSSFSITSRISRSNYKLYS